MVISQDLRKIVPARRSDAGSTSRTTRRCNAAGAVLRKFYQCGNQHGIALVIVLWMVVLLSLIASSFIFAMRTDTQVVSNGTAMAKAQAAADAGVQRALFEWFRPATDAERWLTDGSVRDWSYNDAKLRITLLDDSGKIDINMASEPLLRGLLQAQGVSEQDAVNLVDAILDWRDVDSLKRLHGAEEAEYAAAGLKYKPANAPFQTIEEVQLVIGMSAQLYRRIAPLITVYSRQPGVNWQIAPRAVLLAVPGVTAAQVEEYLAQREAGQANKQPIPLFAPGAAYFSPSTGSKVIVRAEAHMPDGTLFVREAVAMRVPNSKRPYTFLSWKEGAVEAAKEESTETPIEKP